MATKKQVKFWRKEMEVCDTLYKGRVKQWTNLLDRYDLRYTEKIRDIDDSEAVRVPMFYQVVQQTIASIAFNYPKLFFTVEDDEGEGARVGDVLERAAYSWMRLANVKPHVHQAIFDALCTGVGWLRMDYNPPGDDMIAPYVANDSMSEDLVAINRVSPAYVHVDPLCPPHQLGHARYIMETMWLPLEYLKKDDNIQHRREIKATASAEREELGYGDTYENRSDSGEMAAVRDAVLNGEMVKVRRIHDRMNRKQIMFAEGVDEAIQEIDHPFVKMVFPQAVNMFGEPIFDEEETPVLDFENGEIGTGFLTEQGFPFVPIRFDHSFNSFYPTPRMEYLKDLQDLVVESMSRQSAILKRSARQGLVAEVETQKNPNLIDNLRRGDDGEWHTVLDPGNLRELNYGGVPGEQYTVEDRAIMHIQMVSALSDIGGDGRNVQTATEAGLVAAAASILREWMEVRVSDAYEGIVRNAFQIMGDPRYEPESFSINVAPNGKGRLTRALRNADFLWNYRIHVQAGSTRPLFEQLQQGKAIDFVDRAYNMPEFDKMEVAKFMTASYEVADPELLLNADVNEEAQRAVELENEVMVNQLQDPGVVPGQDHQAHMEAHGNYQMHPMYQQLAADPMQAQRIQMIDQVVAQHIGAHQQSGDQTTQQATAPQASQPLMGLRSRINQNAQNLSQEVRAETMEVTG